MYLVDVSAQEKLDNFFRKFHLSQYGKRELILHASDISSNVFYIRDGYIRVYRLSEQGDELTLTILSPGDFFPLTYGFHPVKNQYFLESMTPLAVWKSPQETFLDFITEDRDVFYNLITRSFVQFEGFLSRMEYYMHSSAYLKVAAALIACAQTIGRLQDDNSVIIPVPLTHRDIATMIGATRETTSLEMKKLEKQGFISKSRKYIRIHNHDIPEEYLLKIDSEPTLFNQI